MCLHCCHPCCWSSLLISSSLLPCQIFGSCVILAKTTRIITCTLCMNSQYNSWEGPLWHILIFYNLHSHALACPYLCQRSGGFLECCRFCLKKVSGESFQLDLSLYKPQLIYLPSSEGRSSSSCIFCNINSDKNNEKQQESDWDHYKTEDHYFSLDPPWSLIPHWPPLGGWLL